VGSGAGVGVGFGLGEGDGELPPPPESQDVNGSARMSAVVRIVKKIFTFFIKNSLLP